MVANNPQYRMYNSISKPAFQQSMEGQRFTDHGLDWKEFAKQLSIRSITRWWIEEDLLARRKCSTTIYRNHPCCSVECRLGISTTSTDTYPYSVLSIAMFHCPFLSSVRVLYVTFILFWVQAGKSHEFAASDQSCWVRIKARLPPTFFANIFTSPPYHIPNHCSPLSSWNGYRHPYWLAANAL